jgi:tetratricopeptide (TPR) repeat protein
MMDTVRFPETCYETPLYNKKVISGQLGVSRGRKKVQIRMIRSAKAVLLIAALGFVLMAQTAPAQTAPAQAPAPAQAAPAQTAPAPGAPAGAADDRAGAYYNFAMGRLYAEMAGAQGNREYAIRAVKYYQEALKLAPTVAIVADELTELYLHLNRLADAIAVAEEMLKKDPDNVNARRILGSVYTRMAQNGRDAEASLQKAIEQYRKITAKEPGDAESWTTLGDLYRASNNSPEAEKAYKAALKADAGNTEALKSLAKLYMDLGDTKSAIEKLKAATDKTPNEETLADLGGAYGEMGKHKEAAEAFRQALEMAPDNEKVARALAEEYLALSPPQLDEARKIYERLAATNRREAWFPLRLSEIYRAQHDLGKARAASDRARQLDPESLPVRMNEAMLLESEGKLDEAIAVYRAMVDDIGRAPASEESRKERYEILGQLAQAYEKGKRWAEMAKALDESEKLASSSAEKAGVCFTRGAMLERQKQYDASEKQFRKVLELDPKHADALNYLGYMLADRNVRLEEASQLVKKALDMQPENGAFLDSMGWVYYRQGKYSEAQGFLERALEHMPDPTVYDHLGDVFAKLGRTKEAVAQWQASLKESQKPGTAEVDAEELARVNRKLDEAQAKLAKENHK